jgi:hypothetical protein
LAETAFLLASLRGHDGRDRVSQVRSLGTLMADAMLEWENLYRFVNSKSPLFGTVGVRDPDALCEEFDGKHYDGQGSCESDGHYLCIECSKLSPEAPRFSNDDAGRGDRLRLYWARSR